MRFLAGALFLAVIGYCLLWPVFSPYEANEVDFSVSRQGPSADHPLGTDQFGRDLLTRLAEGGRTSLLIVSAALALILVFGLVYGTVAASFGRKTDALLMRLLDGLFALPRLPIAIVILAGLRLRAQNVPTIAFALGVVGWMLTARLVRSHVISLRAREYVHAARALGAGWFDVARRHLVPNTVGILLIAVLLELPTVVVGEALLAVLGLGPEPPRATWGNVAQEGLHFGRVWMMFIASAIIAFFAISAYVLVDALHDRLDPRRRQIGAFERL
jgi:ABC-type dipeptide/oligopeptide/nickel transport system permease subunit